MHFTVMRPVNESMTPLIQSNEIFIKLHILSITFRELGVALTNDHNYYNLDFYYDYYCPAELRLQILWQICKMKRFYDTSHTREKKRPIVSQFSSDF